MVTLFHDMMHKEIEVYVDDMIEKSRTKKGQVRVLRKLFLRLRRFQLKLNPAKYTFGARSGKLLGFVVSDKRIKIDLDKVKAKQELPPRLFNNSMGCVLGQHDQTRKKERAIYYLSKKLTECETRYSPIENLCYDLDDSEIEAVYVVSHVLSNLENKSPKLDDGAECFEWKDNQMKAVKGSAIADFLAIRVQEDYEPLNFDFSNEDLMCVVATEEDLQEGHPWKLNFDGASNAVVNGIGAVLVSPDDDHYPFTSKLDFDCTNNIDEYEACIMGIRVVIEIKIKVLEHQRRRKNDCPWYQNILRYVKNRKYPDQATENDKRTLRRLANDYDLDGEILYKRGKDQVLLRSVDAVEAKKILEKVHEGVCGTHANGFMMARQIMRFGYYWSTLEGDCINYTRRYHKCQIYRRKIHVPPSPLHVMTSPWPFSM
ncbi:uncharacterized protein LOC105797395 [Gossypium raimondii]|uniref:uncharacterized protein LOC105797395 n=1 Tax=Gossypium raimondii TaxID=29730 RepID=UPI00227C2573|nr:uncharacterized protein LOC105797395 [Gossypium raimondii]